MTTRTTTHAVAVVLASLFAAANARAQAPTAATSASAAPSSPPPAAASAPADVVGGHEAAPDHDRVIGRFGLTYFGISNVLIGTVGTGSQAVTAPVIGVRYWMKPNLGIDAGIGLGFSNGSTNTAGASTNNPSQFGILLHGGVPLALASGSHFVFEVIPEATIGFATGSITGVGGAPNISTNGFRLDIGARAGGEISFGFMGIPQLSMVASIGFYIHDESWGSSPSGGSSSGGQNLTFATSVQSNPWSIFADNIAAIYYF